MWFKKLWCKVFHKGYHIVQMHLGFYDNWDTVTCTKCKTRFVE